MKFPRATECITLVAGGLLLCGAAAAAHAASSPAARPDGTAASETRAAQRSVASPVNGPAAARPAGVPTSSAAQRESDQAALKAPTAEQFRPTGPVNVTADRAELVQGDYAIYSGQVVMTSNTMDMTGNRLEMRQLKNGQYTATLTGNPAHMKHPSSGPADPPVTAHALHMFFDSATQQLTLTDDAKLTRGSNVVEGKTIHYDALSHHVQANGGTNGRVHMVIQPPPPDNASTGHP
ncbi:MAG TPA: lipopolysaccharide transport periplasmic protein LptA [Nevskiaceae bacterium]